MPLIPLKAGKPIHRQIYETLRQRMLSGELGAGSRLPSTRAMAETLAVSRTIVVLAYDHLLAEGYIEGRAGSGTYVSAGLPSRVSATKASPHGGDDRWLSQYGKRISGLDLLQPRIGAPRQPYDFRYGRTALENFPQVQWRRTVARCLRHASEETLLYGDAQGLGELRKAIAAHLKWSRAVVADPSQILIVNGSQQALDLIARVLLNPGDRVAIEEPQYQGARAAFLSAGAELHLCCVDGEGLDPATLPRRAKLVYLTPSHQFPTGATLPLDRRIALLDWARGSGAMILEDDYDGEFRYEARAVESLQGLDMLGRVLYVGTFSRTLFPAVRIGYMVAPENLVAPLTKAKWLADRHTSTLEQQALAGFLRSGDFARYLRKVRRQCEKRRDAAVDCIGRFFGSGARIQGETAGAHLLVWLKNVRAERGAELVERAAQQGVGVNLVSPYYAGPQPEHAGIVLSYASLPAESIREGLQRLAAVAEGVSFRASKSK